ncbi:hypothetical protein ABFB09_07530 [Dehalogenimonas sp. THU2]|uniref:hypothetical protein n=1 Tax=Dehalogenimonas sp. THU2 TaxID=3151121 RepID=UPI00321889C7
MTDTTVPAKTPVITIILAVSLALALVGAGLLAFAWRNNTSTIDALRDDVTTLNASLTAAENENTELRSQLSDLEDLYPPRHFASREALLAWLAVAVPGLPEGNSLQRHLDLQELALAQGYIWSIWVDVSQPDITYVGSHVVAGDTVYLVDTTNGAILALHTSPYFIE